jgi:hypothetical protein
MLRTNLSWGARIPIASRTASASSSRMRNGVASAKAAAPVAATAWRSSGTRTRITSLNFCCFEELPAAGANHLRAMSHFGNVPANVLVGTVEKLVAKMDEADLASVFECELSTMPGEACDAFIEAILDAFRERGESSEDAVEGAGTTIGGIVGRDRQAINALVEYARTNTGLLKEATTRFVELRPDLVSDLPVKLRTAIAERLAHAR